ncbi:MAG: sulfatase, partial [Planctomycetales bacterium]
TNHITYRKFIPKDSTLEPAETKMALPLKEITIAERLKEAGYATGFFGKWHLADTPKRDGLGASEFYPEHQGFDVNLGGCAHGGPPSYFDPYRIHNLKDRREGEYLPDRLADEAIRFMKQNRDKPFFVSLWNYTVHWPMQAPSELIKKYEKRLGPGLKDARYGAMIEAMDAAIGRVFSAIDDLELANRTVVIFTSDNGGFTGVADNRPLRSGKGFLWEGGIRVPLIIRWPGATKPGSVSNTPVVSMDLHPTILAAAGLKPGAGQAPDGESLLPLLRNQGRLHRSAVFFHYPNYAWHSANRLGSAVRKGDFKLIERFDDGSVELYNLKNDLGETRDLATQMPDQAAELKQLLHAWRKETGAAIPTRKK